MDETCRVLIVDDDVPYAAAVADDLDKLRDSLSLPQLDIELANTAYYVAGQLAACDQEPPPWDVIFADVFMPKPSARPNSGPDPQARQVTWGRWPCWQYDYSWNSQAPHTPDDGGLYIVKTIERQRAQARFASIKLVLISNRLSGADRDRVFRCARENPSWLTYYDKADWEDPDPRVGPTRLDTNAFRLALIHTINQRRSELWGDLALQRGNPEFVYQSPAMADAIIYAKTLALESAVTTVLITGERGTGKEAIACMIHRLRMELRGRQGRADNLFIRVDVPCLQADLLESELFGHRKGAFTGAYEDRDGLAAAAADGTLYLSEIGDLPLTLQSKFLNFLQDRRFRRMGENVVRRFNGELVICATNRPLHKMAKMEPPLFLPDLLDRIEQHWLRIPPLAQRPADIVPIARAALKVIQRAELTTDAEKWLQQQAWPGNVRQLVNLVQAVAVKSVTHEVDAAALEKEARAREFPPSRRQESGASPVPSPKDITPERAVSGDVTWEQVKKLPYGQRVAVMIAAKRLWSGTGTQLAVRLHTVGPNLDTFWNEARRNICAWMEEKGVEDTIGELQSYLSQEHHDALRDFVMKGGRT